MNTLRETIKWQNKKLQTYDLWVNILIKNGRIDRYLIDRGYNKVGIYGFGKLGKNLADLLIDSECELVFLMDNSYSKQHNSYGSIPCIFSGRPIPETDIIIITAPEAESLVKSQYRKKYNCSVITLAELLFVMQ